MKKLSKKARQPNGALLFNIELGEGEMFSFVYQSYLSDMNIKNLSETCHRLTDFNPLNHYQIMHMKTVWNIAVSVHIGQ